MKISPKFIFLLSVISIAVLLMSLNKFGHEQKNTEIFIPAAEDVLIQKIQGDRTHLLMIAYYTKENYAKPYITIQNNGEELIFRDDGKNDDKTAGDGFYTAKISADVEVFRQEAITLDAYTRTSLTGSVHFLNRAMFQDPDIADAFSIQKLDNNEAVSIAGLSLANDSITNTLKDHSLFITNLKVVEDSTRSWNPCTQKGNPNGVWTFQFLMRQLATVTPDKPATDREVSDFVLNFFNHWSVMQVMNGDTVPARPLLRPTIIDPWLEKSRAEGWPPNMLDMKFAPFKLLAIVNRFDKRNLNLNEPAGEVRFVFDLIRGDCTDSKDYTLALEYAVNQPQNCDSLHAWAQQWYNLKDLVAGSKQYNDLLQSLTDKVSLCGTNVSQANQSCLNTLPQEPFT